MMVHLNRRLHSVDYWTFFAENHVPFTPLSPKEEEKAAKGKKTKLPVSFRTEYSALTQAVQKTLN